MTSFSVLLRSIKSPSHLKNKNPNLKLLHKISQTRIFSLKLFSRKNFSAFRPCHYVEAWRKTFFHHSVNKSLGMSLRWELLGISIQFRRRSEAWTVCELWHPFKVPFGVGGRKTVNGGERHESAFNDRLARKAFTVVLLSQPKEKEKKKNESNRIDRKYGRTKVNTERSNKLISLIIQGKFSLASSMLFFSGQKRETKMSSEAA